MIVGIILSHTIMNGGHFCTTVAVEEDGQWKQIRMLVYGRQPTAQLFGLTPDHAAWAWIPGKMVSFNYSTTKRTPRPTHPEDRDVVAESVMLRGDAPGDKYRAAVRSFTYNSLRELFPFLLQQGLKCFSVSSEHPRSLGYARVHKIAMDTRSSKPAIMVWATRSDKFHVPVVDQALVRRFGAGEFEHGEEFDNILVRFSLANPWDQYDPPRCYLMCSHIIGL